MNDDRSLERAARSWLEEGPAQAPDRAVAAALSRIQTTQQDRDLAIPWRLPTMFTNRIAVAALATALILAVGGVAVSRFSGPGTAPPPPATVAPAPTSAAPTTAPTKAPASTPALPAPAALQGRWRAEIAPSVAILDFTATRYTINWGILGGGSGFLEVKGDEITFSGDNQCPGSGTYRWSIEGDKLHFESLEPDPCPFRNDYTRNKTYTRSD